MEAQAFAKAPALFSGQPSPRKSSQHHKKGPLFPTGLFFVGRMIA